MIRTRAKQLKAKIGDYLGGRRDKGRHRPVLRRGVSRRMRGIITITIIAIIAVLTMAERSGWLRTQRQPDSQHYDGKIFTVVKVVDGDTLDLAEPDGNKAYTSVRLWGVDTPETKHPSVGVMYYGKEASEFARQAALEKQVVVRLEPFRKSRDKYGRLLAYIYLPDGKVLNEELIKRGYGYADERFGHMLSRKFMRLQKEAQREKRGLWQQVQPDQWPTWYRQRHDPDYKPAAES